MHRGELAEDLRQAHRRKRPKTLDVPSDQLRPDFVPVVKHNPWQSLYEQINQPNWWDKMVSYATGHQTRRISLAEVDAEEQPPSQERLRYLWYLARKYDKVLRKQIQRKNRLQMLQIKHEVTQDDPSVEQAKTKTKEPWYLIEENGDIRRIWDFLIGLLLLYSFTVVPYM